MTWASLFSRGTRKDAADVPNASSSGTAAPVSAEPQAPEARPSYAAQLSPNAEPGPAAAAGPSRQAPQQAPAPSSAAESRKAQQERLLQQAALSKMDPVRHKVHCLACGVAFSTYKQLAQHLEAKHGGINSDDVNYFPPASAQRITTAGPSKQSLATDTAFWPGLSGAAPKPAPSAGAQKQASASGAKAPTTRTAASLLRSATGKGAGPAAASLVRPTKGKGVTIVFGSVSTRAVTTAGKAAAGAQGAAGGAGVRLTTRPGVILPPKRRRLRVEGAVKKKKLSHAKRLVLQQRSEKAVNAAQQEVDREQATLTALLGYHNQLYEELLATHALLTQQDPTMTVTGAAASQLAAAGAGGQPQTSPRKPLLSDSVPPAIRYSVLRLKLADVEKQAYKAHCRVLGAQDKLQKALGPPAAEPAAAAAAAAAAATAAARADAAAAEPAAAAAAPAAAPPQPLHAPHAPHLESIPEGDAPAAPAETAAATAVAPAPAAAPAPKPAPAPAQAQQPKPLDKRKQAFLSTARAPMASFQMLLGGGGLGFDSDTDSSDYTTDDGSSENEGESEGESEGADDDRDADTDVRSRDLPGLAGLLDTIAMAPPHPQQSSDDSAVSSSNDAANSVAGRISALSLQVATPVFTSDPKTFPGMETATAAPLLPQSADVAASASQFPSLYFRSAGNAVGQQLAAGGAGFPGPHALPDSVTRSDGHVAGRRGVPAGGPGSLPHCLGTPGFDSVRLQQAMQQPPLPPPPPPVPAGDTGHGELEEILSRARGILGEHIAASGVTAGAMQRQGSSGVPAHASSSSSGGVAAGGLPLSWLGSGAAAAGAAGPARTHSGSINVSAVPSLADGVANPASMDSGVHSSQPGSSALVQYIHSLTAADAAAPAADSMQQLGPSLSQQSQGGPGSAAALPGALPVLAAKLHALQASAAASAANSSSSSTEAMTRPTGVQQMAWVDRGMLQPPAAAAAAAAAARVVRSDSAVQQLLDLAAAAAAGAQAQAGLLGNAAAHAMLGQSPLVPMPGQVPVSSTPADIPSLMPSLPPLPPGFTQADAARRLTRAQLAADMAAAMQALSSANPPPTVFMDNIHVGITSSGVSGMSGVSGTSGSSGAHGATATIATPAAIVRNGATTYACDLCRVQCNSLSAMQQHIVSKKHLTRVARKALLELEAAAPVVGDAGNAGGPVTSATYVGPSATPHPMCKQIITVELNQVVTELLTKIKGFQERAMLKDPIKAAAKRWYVCGLREVRKACRTRKAHSVVIAPNIEEVSVDGGLDDHLKEVLKLCEEHSIPVVFALTRKKLGEVYGHRKRVSAVAILGYNGVDELHADMLRIAATGREEWETHAASAPPGEPHPPQAPGDAEGGGDSDSDDDPDLPQIALSSRGASTNNNAGAPGTPPGGAARANSGGGPSSHRPRTPNRGGAQRVATTTTTTDATQYEYGYYNESQLSSSPYHAASMPIAIAAPQGYILTPPGTPPGVSPQHQGVTDVQQGNMFYPMPPTVTYAPQGSVPYQTVPYQPMPYTSTMVPTVPNMAMYGSQTVYGGAAYGTMMPAYGMYGMQTVGYEQMGYAHGAGGAQQVGWQMPAAVAPAAMPHVAYAPGTPQGGYATSPQAPYQRHGHQGGY